MLELLNDLIDVTPIDLGDLGDYLPDTDNEDLLKKERQCRLAGQVPGQP
jgi:hypothetical protein